MRIELPWPSAKLNPNSSKGKHWASTYDARKQARADGYNLTHKAAASSLGECVAMTPGQSIKLCITFVHPDRRARDRDNLLAALKPSLDGVADALGVNDSQFDPITIRREYGSRPGAVIVEVF